MTPLGHLTMCPLPINQMQAETMFTANEWLPCFLGCRQKWKKLVQLTNGEHIAVKSNIALDHVGSLEICSGFSICSLCLPQQPAAPRACVRACKRDSKDRYIRVLLFDLFVYIVCSHLHAPCALLTTVLPSRNCCYANCSQFVVKHSRGFAPPPFLHLHRGSSLGLWCSSCLVHIFSASSLKSLPLRTQRSAWWNHPHTVYIAPHNTVSHGRASVSQPSVCALNGISLCMALPKLLHSE